LSKKVRMNNKLLILQRLQDWIIFVQPCLRKFPKTERFTLAQRIENSSLECIDWVVKANLDKTNRPQHILQARVTLERLKILIRVAKAQSWIDVKRYEFLSEKMDEMGKMLGGWANVSKS
jgi:hypothetical protein